MIQQTDYKGQYHHLPCVCSFVWLSDCLHKMEQYQNFHGILQPISHTACKDFSLQINSSFTKVTNVNPELSGGDVKLFVFAANALGTSEPFIIESENYFRHLKSSKHAVEGENYILVNAYTPR